MQTSLLIRDLFESFHDQKIIYCHWKSNQHINASFKGDTDFDILFDFSQKVQVAKIFKENGFVLFSPPYNRKYAQIDDYIAIDYEQCRIIHFHTHYRLMIGASGLKEYHYAIENKLLHSRVFSNDYNCYLIDPKYEFILLILRLSLKVGKSWKFGFNSHKEIINSTIELNWLKERVSLESLYETVKELNLPYNKKDILDIYQNGLHYESLYALSLLKNQIIDLKKASSLDLFRQRLFKWIYFQYGRIIRKTGISYVPKQRVKDKDGFSIAVLGSDGSGKSTQLINLKKLLSKKIDVETFYLGSNKGSKSNVRKILEHVRDKNLTFNIKPLQNLLTILLAFSIAGEKHLRLKKAYKLKKRGVLIIFDRFPQNQNYGYNDGPILKRMMNSKNPLFRKLGKIEQKIYSPPAELCPDIIFKLIADPEVLSKRRNMTIDEVNHKQNNIIQLIFQNKSATVTIDANDPIDDVTSNLLKEIQERWLSNN